MAEKPPNYEVKKNALTQLSVAGPTQERDGSVKPKVKQFKPKNKKNPKAPEETLNPDQLDPLNRRSQHGHFKPVFQQKNKFLQGNQHLVHANQLDNRNHKNDQVSQANQRNPNINPGYSQIKPNFKLHGHENLNQHTKQHLLGFKPKGQDLHIKSHLLDLVSHDHQPNPNFGSKQMRGNKQRNFDHRQQHNPNYRFGADHGQQGYPAAQNVPFQNEPGKPYKYFRGNQHNQYKDYRDRNEDNEYRSKQGNLSKQGSQPKEYRGEQGNQPKAYREEFQRKNIVVENPRTEQYQRQGRNTQFHNSQQMNAVHARFRDAPQHNSFEHISKPFEKGNPAWKNQDNSAKNRPNKKSAIKWGANQKPKNNFSNCRNVNRQNSSNAPYEMKQKAVSAAEMPNLLTFSRDQPDVEKKSTSLHSDDSDVESVASTKASEKPDISSDDDDAASAISYFSNIHGTAKGVIGVFWDIENCPVSKGDSPRLIVKKIRDTFYGQRKEDIFIVACDVTCLPKNVKSELNSAQVDLLHVDSTQKNAADYKLREYLRRFVEQPKPEGSCIILISGDVDFASDLHNLRYRHSIYVVLIPNQQVKAELCDLANEVIPFYNFIQSIAKQTEEVVDDQIEYIFIQNVPNEVAGKVFVILRNVVRSLSGELVSKIVLGSCIIQFKGKLNAGKAMTYFSEKKNALFESDSVIITQTNILPKLPQKAKPLKINKEPWESEVLVEPIQVEPPPCPKTFVILILESGHVAGPDFWKGFLQNILRDRSAHDVKVQNNQIHVHFESLNAAKRVKTMLETDQQNELKVIGILKDAKHGTLPENVQKQCAVSELITNCKKGFTKKFQAISSEHTKKKDEVKVELSGLNEVLKSLPSNTKPSEFACIQSTLQAINDKLTELENQEDEFQIAYTQINSELDLCNDLSLQEVEDKIAVLRKNFGRECHLFSKALPIYAMKSKVIQMVQANNVSILLAETGSGKSTQLTQYLYQAGLADNKVIVCTQPRKLAARSLADFVSSEMGCALGKLVGSKVGLQAKYSNETKILYMTDYSLLNECLKDPDLQRYSCVIVDEVHERSIFTDLLLGMLQKILQRRKDFRIVLTSATIDPTCFKAYFAIKDDAVFKVSGRVFPIEVIWNNKTVQLGYNFVEQAVLKAFEVHMSEDKGHILVFVTTPAETLKACDAFEQLVHQKKSAQQAQCFPLHGKLNAEEQRQVFAPTKKGLRKVIFATNCAETSITVPGISYVIDTGMAKELQYDVKSQTSILKVSFVNQSSAEQRKGRAGRTQAGKCFRLYSQDNYNEMNARMEPEIKRVNLGQALLKLMELGIENPCNFEFVDSPPTSSFLVAMQNLSTLGAVENDKLTDLGRKMAKLSLEPSLAKLVIRGFEEGIGYEAVITAVLASVSGMIFFRLEENRMASDLKKTQFCQEEGDFHTFLEVYKEWVLAPKEQKSQWCVANYINGKSMKITNDSVRDLLQTCQQELNISISTAYSSQPAANEILQYIIMEVFKNNLCIFSGHSQTGYITMRNFEAVIMHPSSSLCYLGRLTPKFVIYQTKMLSNKNYISNITPVSDGCLFRAIDKGLFAAEDIEKLKSLTISPVHFGPFGNRVLRQFCGPKGTNRMQVQEELSQLINDQNVRVDLEFQAGMLIVSCKEIFHRKVNEYMVEVIEAIVSEVKNEDEVITLDGSSEGFFYLLSAGAQITEVIVSPEFISFSLADVSKKAEVLEFCNKTGHIFRVKEIFRRKEKNVIISFKTVKAAMEVANLINTNQICTIKREFAVKTERELKDMPPFCLEVSWLRRPCKGVAYVKFPSSEDYYTYSPRLLLSSRLYIHGSPIVVKVCKRNPQELVVSQLPLFTTRESLKKVLGQVLDNVKYELVVVLEKEFETTVPVFKEIENTLARVFSQYTNQGGVIVNLWKPKNHFSTFRGKIFFRNSRDGQTTFNALNNTTFPGTVYPISMTVKINSSFVVHKDIFTLMKENLQEAMEVFKAASLEKDILKIEVKECTHNENYVSVCINSNNVRDMELAHSVLQDLLKGETIPCLGNPLREKLFSFQGKQELRDLEKRHGGKIHLDYTKKTVSIMGPTTALTLVKNGINSYLDRLETQSTKMIPLAYPSKPQGFLKLLLRTYDTALEGLQVQCNLVSIELNLYKHSMTVFGSREAIQQVEDILIELGHQLDGQELSREGEETCPVCLCSVTEAEQPYRLQCCGHLYCRDCIDCLMRDASIPLICASQSCGEPFVMEDLRQLLSDDKKSAIASAALKYLVQVNGKQFKYCPTPECPVVYRVCPKESQDTKLYCKMCYNQICTRCNVLFHHGIPCELYQSKDNAEELKVWLEKDPQNRKLCPNCNVGIEKNEGCNHMTCFHCSAHICWLCMKVFPTGRQVYDHQPYCPNNQ